MSLSRRRIGLTVLFVLIAIISVLAAGWFLILPGIIENEIHKALESAENKIGRHITVDGVHLRGLTEASIDKIALSDLNTPNSDAARALNTRISLRGIPSGKDFSIASIKISNLEVMLDIKDGHTNFDDLIEKAKSDKNSDDSDDSGQSKPENDSWKRYITPLPEFEIKTLTLNSTPIEIRKNLEIQKISASQLRFSDSTAEKNTHDLSGLLSVTLAESGSPHTYQSQIAGTLQDKNHGSFTLSCPKSNDGQIPEILRQDDTRFVFDGIQFILPTTFVVQNLAVSKDDKNLIAASSARIRLMQLPPKKVSGVYFKEIELIDASISDAITQDGSVILNTAKKLIHQWIPKVSQDSVEKPSEPKSKSFNPKDYFFSQRFFIQNGSFLLEDQRGDSEQTLVSINNIQAEVGYRSIRKVVDYQISLSTKSPVELQMGLDGQYVMRNDTTKGHLDLSYLRSGEGLEKWQSQWRILLSWLDISKTELSGRIDFDANIPARKFSLDTTLSVNDFVLSSDVVGPNPLSISGEFATHATIDHANHDYRIDRASYKASNGAHIDGSLRLSKVTHTVKERSSGKNPVERESWQFEVTSNLPEQSMQILFDGLPAGMRPDLDGMEWKGNLGLEFYATGYLDKVSETQHKFKINVSTDFGVIKWPTARDLNALNQGMTHNVIDPNALNPHTIVIPPSIYPVLSKGDQIYDPKYEAQDIRMLYPEWVVFEDLNPWLIQLVTTTEDGSFFTHSGFSPMQIKAALERNIDRSAFSRGASTISMQLIKNLYFDRTKSISRKFQEVLYTWLMESILHVPKQRIMELYFNIIEFGPEVYGIEQAAKYYFGKRSMDLSLKECAFLMAIIPNPRRGAYYRSQGQLERGIQKTMNFYIQEMHRRKCDPDTLSKMRARYSKLGQEMPFEPCCPPKDSLRLMMDSGTMEFYVPDEDDPNQSGYVPELYTPDGSLLNPMMRKRTCGMHNGSDSELESIFETLSSDTATDARHGNETL